MRAIVIVLAVVAIGSAPMLDTVPDALAPYMHLLKTEPVIVCWLRSHLDTLDPMNEFIADRTQDRSVRKRAFHMRKKLRDSR